MSQNCIAKIIVGVLLHNYAMFCDLKSVKVAKQLGKMGELQDGGAYSTPPIPLCWRLALSCPSRYTPNSFPCEYHCIPSDHLFTAPMGLIITNSSAQDPTSHESSVSIKMAELRDMVDSLITHETK